MSDFGKCPRVAKVQVVNIRVADVLGWQKSGGKSPKLVSAFQLNVGPGNLLSTVTYRSF